jgi:hypothetical protein
MFLWGLVAAMTIHGFLHADDYGTASTVLGGVSLTMSIWKESLSEATRSLFWTQPRYVGIPRALVVAALKETALHPGIHTIPDLQRALQRHQYAWDLFRNEEVQWMLTHADLVGGLLSDPEGQDVWVFWEARLADQRIHLIAAKEAACPLPKQLALKITACKQHEDAIDAYTAAVAHTSEAVEIWNKILYYNDYIPANVWWAATHRREPIAFEHFYLQLKHLHNVSDPGDARVSHLIQDADRYPSIIPSLTSWEHRLMKSLLLGDIWKSCLEHIRRRENRVRDLMMAAGIQDMMNAHDRALNASMRSVKDPKLVQDWFGEMAGYAWWMGDDIPNIVRRCVGQEGGDCARIGPTEIASLSAQMVEKRRIVGDWFRRIFIGMWNGLPVVLLLFVMELIIICIPRRRVVSFSSVGGPMDQALIKDDQALIEN